MGLEEQLSKYRTLVIKEAQRQNYDLGKAIDYYSTQQSLLMKRSRFIPTINDCRQAYVNTAKYIRNTNK